MRIWQKDMAQKAAFIVALLSAVCGAPIAASALVVRHDRDAAQFVKLARDFPQTAMLRHSDGKDGLGGRSFNRKLGKYRDDASFWTQYNSEKDRKILGWQRVITYVVCMMVSPFLGIFVWSLTQN